MTVSDHVTMLEHRAMRSRLSSQANYFSLQQTILHWISNIATYLIWTWI